MQNEIWKPIKGYEGLYEISNYGRVKSLEHQLRYGNGYGLHTKKEIIKKLFSSYGYKRTVLTKNKINKHFQVHRLVAEAFIPNPENKPEIDHIDGDKSNNHASNLRWATRMENIHNPISMEKKRRNYRVVAQKKGKESPKAKKIVGVNIQTGDIVRYGALIEAEGFLRNKISACLRGRNSKHRGYKWYYENEYNELNNI